MKEKVIVTGGCGFIGSHLVDRLVERGFDVFVIDDLSAESNEKFYFNDKAHYIKTDINELYEVDYKIFKNARALFHLAAESRIGPAIKNPMKATMTNVVGTVRLLELARTFDVGRFIYSSTSSVYGLNDKYASYEDDPVDCLNPYSATKFAGEEMCRMYSKMYDLKTCVFRYFNVYGERSPTKGIYAPVIGLFQKWQKEGKPLTIVGDGNQRRDFVHVYDVVGANLNALRDDIPYYTDEHNGAPINIGTGKTHSINDIARCISNNIEYIPARPGEALCTRANTNFSRIIFDWQAQIDVKEWISKQFDA
jgi:UDP-glucose 4-epimerase